MSYTSFDFPHTHFYDDDLRELIKKVCEMSKTLRDFVSINALKFANPIQWNITTQYEKNTIVIDPQSGTAYISVQPVPSGIGLTDTDYWTVVFDLEQFVTKANNNFTLRVEEQTTLNATFVTNKGSWVIWGGVLYEALSNIIAGDQYVIDSNIKRITVEEITGDLINLNTTDKSNLVAAINDVLVTLNTIVGDLSELNTEDKSNLVAAINDVLVTLSAITGNLSDLNTEDKSNLVAAINDVLVTLNTVVGDLSELDTEDKRNLVAAINDVLVTLSAITGDLSDLDTKDKSNLVAAINDVLIILNSITGDLSDLDTEDKSNLVAAINEIHNDMVHYKYTVADYGIFPDGTDVSDAVQALLNQNIPVIFNAGTYILSKRLTATGSTYITGSGIGNTILKFVNAGGFEILSAHIFDNYYSSTFNISNLTIVSSVANTTIAAIRFDGETGVTDRVTMNPNLFNVDIHGVDGGYFKECVVLYSCNGATVYGCSFTGNMPSTIPDSYALRVDGDTRYPIGTEFMLTSNKYAHFDKCIVGDYCEGLIITSSIFLASDYGVYWVSTTGPHPHLAITSTHMNSFVSDIYVDNICQLNICNNLLYLQSTNDNGKFIQILSNTYRSIENLITNNNFIQLTNHIMDGIALNADYSVISNNLFSIAYAASFAVRVLAGSTNTEISNNILRDTANGMYNAGTETRSDWQLDGIVDYTGSAMTRQGTNPVLYDEDGLTAYVAFATESATVSANDLLATIPIPAELHSIGNIPTLSNTSRLFTFKLLSNGQLRSNDAIPANTHIVCCITAKYKAM